MPWNNISRVLEAAGDDGNVAGEIYELYVTGAWDETHENKDLVQHLNKIIENSEASAPHKNAA